LTMTTLSCLRAQLGQALLLLAIAILPLTSAAATGGEPAHVQLYPAPSGEPLSRDFTVAVDHAVVPVYLAKVAPGDDAARWKAMDDAAHSGDYADHASFASFDIVGPVSILITCPSHVDSVKVLPTSAHIQATIRGTSVSLNLAEPRNLTIEVNGDWIHSLHLFANPVETDAPKPDDPNVMYFGPGIHEVREGIHVTDGKTLYIAGGAILRGIGAGGGAVVSLEGNHVALRGRGVIDGSGCPIHTRNLLYVHGTDIAIDGVILHDSSTWNVPMRRCDRVKVTNLKIFGCRANSDGIDICNSRDVTVDGCFIRTLDDLVVVKSDAGQGEVRHVLVQNCVLWNQVAHALSIGAELRETVDDVCFKNCDVIHDIGREWTLRVYHCDSASISNVRFQDIRVEESRRLMSVWIGRQIWSRDTERGHVRDVTFSNIHAISRTPAQIELKGFDAGHGVDGVAFDGVVINDQPLVATAIKANEFAKNVVVKP
jgi:hypothetical protein